MAKQRRTPEELYNSLKKYYEIQRVYTEETIYDVNNLSLKSKVSQEKAFKLITSLRDKLDEEMYLLFYDEPHVREHIQSKEESHLLEYTEDILQIAEFINHVGELHEEHYTSSQRKQIINNLTKAVELLSKGEDK